ARPGGVEPPAHGHAPAREGAPRPDDDRVRTGIGRQRVERFAAAHPKAAALTGRETPDAVVRPEDSAVFVDDVAAVRSEARALEERAIVAAAEEARLLALRARGRDQPRRRRL